VTSFVNRESELAILSNFLRQVESGRGQMVGIAGEPGIGKSRLLTEFHRQIGQGRVFWVGGRCLSYGTQIPYLLALDLLRSNWGIGEADSPEAITDKVRSLVGLRGERLVPVVR
jgi:predicted ATPase